MLLKYAFPAVFGSIDSPLSTVNTKRASAYSEYRRSAVLEQATKNGGLGDVEAWGEEIRDVDVLSAVLNMEPCRVRRSSVCTGSEGIRVFDGEGRGDEKERIGSVSLMES